jgi:hypothetical protein
MIRTGCALLISAAFVVPVSLSAAPAAAVVAKPIPINDCWITDTGKPQLDSFYYTPHAIDTTDGNQRMKVTAQAHDTGGGGTALGIAEIDVFLYKPEAAFPNVRRVRLHRTDGTRWRGSTTFTPYTRFVGTWHVQAVVLTSNTVKNRLVLPNDPPDRSYNEAQLAVFGATTFTVTAPHPDNRTPVAHSFYVPATVNTTESAKVVTFHALVTDDGSGVAKVLPFFAREGGNGRVWPGGAIPAMTRVGDTNRYVAHVRVPSWWHGHGTRLVFDLEAIDKAGNEIVYDYQDAPQLARYNPYMTVHARTLQNAPKAKVTDLSRHPATVDVRTDSKRVHISVRITLAKPTPAIDAVFVNEHGHLANGRLHLVSGNGRNGIWRGSIVIHHCLAKRSDKSLEMIMRSGHSTISSKHIPIRIRTSDVRAPRFHPYYSSGSPTDDFKITFGEDVAGIAKKTLIVTPTDGDGSVVAGSWACATSSGVTVSCYRGPARSATFTAAATMPVGLYDIVANPHHQLTLTDMAGNPAAGFGRHEVKAP